MRQAPRANCHPERPHCAKGLCKICYDREHGKARYEAKRAEIAAGRKARYAIKRVDESFMRRKRERERRYYERNAEKERAGRREYARKNREREREGHLLRRFGITLNEKQAIITAQGGVCGICGGGFNQNIRACVDHDHTTGVVRGVLCTLCNTMIGSARENESILLRAIDYLRRHGKGAAIA